MAMFPVLCLDVSPTGIATLTAFDVQVPVVGPRRST